MDEATITLIIGSRPMTIGIYYRVSTDTQSIEHQRHSIREWISQKGYSKEQIIEFIDHGISGAASIDKRTSFAKLIEQILAGKIKKCLVFETSRISRDFLGYLKFLELCRKSRCEVEVLGKGIQGFENSQDMLVASIHAFLGQAERERIAERTRSGLAKAKAQGKKLGAPKGHSYNKGRRKEYSKELTEKILMLREEGLSIRKIAAAVSESHDKVQRIIRRSAG